MYTTIIHPLRKALNLSMNEYAVLESIRALSNNNKYNGWCVTSKQQMAEALDLSKQSVHKIVKTLHIKGLVEKGKVPGSIRSVDMYNDIFHLDNVNTLGTSDFLTSNLHLFKDKDTWFTQGKESLPRVKKVYPGSKEGLPVTPIIHLDTNSNTFKKNNTKKSQQYNQNLKRTNEPITKSMFAEFWELYPKKVGRGDTITKWNKICNLPVAERPTWKTIKESVLAHTKSKAWQLVILKKSKKQQIPGPKTWLNNARWENDPAEIYIWEDEDKPEEGSHKTGTTRIQWEEDNGSVDTMIMDPTEKYPAPAGQRKVTIVRAEVSIETWKEVWALAHGGVPT